MSLYYSDDKVTLYHGDCRVELAWLEADVLVTDPPYGTNKMEGNERGGYGRRDLSADQRSGFVIDNDDDTTIRDIALARWGSRGPALVFGSPRMPDPPLLGGIKDRLVWDKKRMGMNGGPWRYRHEMIFVTDGFTRTDDESSSILTAFPAPNGHIHAKPVPLMEHLIEKAPPGMIADPFAGSGSTLVAASHLGRRSIGIEIDERYCEMLATRLQQQTFDFETI